MLSPAEKRFLSELESKARVSWEKNGYEDGLVDNYRAPQRLSVHDTYMLGWYDGEQVRRIRKGNP